MPLAITTEAAEGLRRDEEMTGGGAAGALKALKVGRLCWPCNASLQSGSGSYFTTNSIHLSQTSLLSEEERTSRGMQRSLCHQWLNKDPHHCRDDLQHLLGLQAIINAAKRLPDAQDLPGHSLLQVGGNRQLSAVSNHGLGPNL